MKRLVFLALILGALISGCALNGQHQIKYDQDPVFKNGNWQNGIYSGSYKDGLRSGQGTYVNSRGDKFVGSWYKDRPLFSNAKIVFSNGTSIEVKEYDRHFSLGSYLLKNAVVTWPGGQRFEGDLLLGKKEPYDNSYIYLLMDTIRLHKGSFFVDGKVYEVPEGTSFNGKIYEDNFIAKTDDITTTLKLEDRNVTGVFQAEFFNHKITPHSNKSYDLTFNQSIKVFYNEESSTFPKFATFRGNINKQFKMIDGLLSIPKWGSISIESDGEYFETGRGLTLAWVERTQYAVEQLYQRGFEQYKPKKTIECKAYDGSWIVHADSQCKDGYVHGTANIMTGHWFGREGSIYFLSGTFKRGTIVEGRYEQRRFTNSYHDEYLPFQVPSSTAFNAQFEPHTLDEKPFSLRYRASGSSKYYRNRKLVFEGEIESGHPVKGNCLRPFTNNPKTIFVPGDCTFTKGYRDDANYLAAVEYRKETIKQAELQREREAAQREKDFERRREELIRKDREKARLAEEERRRFLEQEPEQSSIAKAFASLGDSAQRFNAESQRIREQNDRIMSGYYDARSKAIANQTNREAAQKKRATSTKSSSPYSSYEVDTSKPRYTQSSSSSSIPNSSRSSSSKQTASEYKKSSTPKTKTVAKPSTDEQPAKTKEALAFCWQRNEHQKTKGLWLCDGRKQQILLAEKLTEALEAVGCDSYRKKMPYDEGFLYFCGYDLGKGSTDKMTWNRDIRKWRGISKY